VTTAPRDWTQHPGVRIGVGVAKAGFNFAASIAETGTLKGSIKLVLAAAQNAVAGGRGDGVLGGVAGVANTLNPLYALGVAGVDAKAGIETGITRRRRRG
jgi:hypothetical protein